ncbi:hypothetical protein [Microbacterium lacus]|uniref:Uncharacterized protein n=1 Tax=Microbacterium lacus TaxID=415217 RepID=A0ABN2G6P2_9MICO
MSIDTPIRDTASTASKSVDRRTLLKAGAWAAPVVLLTTAIPAAAASTNVVPSNELTVTSGALTASGVAATPLHWAGGKILWTPASGSTTTAAMVSYSVILSGPAGFASQTLYTSSTNLAPGGSIDFAAGNYGSNALPPGRYTITVLASSDGDATAASSYSIVYTVSVSAFSGVATPGKGSDTSYALSFTVSNPNPVPVTVSVALSGSGFATGPTPASFINLLVPANGSIAQPSSGTISATTANQSTGKTATATITAPIDWIVANSTKTFKGGASF